MSKTVYLNVESSTGNLFEYSKEPKDGFDPHEVDGKPTTYRRYLKRGVFGKLVNITSKDSPIGPQISVCLDNPQEEGGETRYFLAIPMNDQKGNISSYATALISYMPNLKEGAPYRVFPFTMEDDNGRKNYGISIFHARLIDKAVDKENKIPRLTFEGRDKDGNVTKKGDIPTIEWDEDHTGKPVPDMKKRNKFLWEVYKENRVGDPQLVSGGGSGVKTFNSKEEGGAEPAQAKKESAPVKKSEPAKEPPMKANQEFDSKAAELKKQPEVVTGTAEADDDDDDLPFG
jgi:hypothetical protein